MFQRVEPEAIWSVSRPPSPARHAAAHPEPKVARATSPSFAVLFGAKSSSGEVGVKSKPNVRYLTSGPVVALESSTHASTRPDEVAMMSGSYCEKIVVV